MEMVEDPDRSCAPGLPFRSEVSLSEVDTRDLFPRAVRPVVFKLLWTVLVLLLVVLLVLAISYRRSFG